MRKSIAARFFIAAITLLLGMLLLQAFVISRSFNRLYLSSIRQSIQRELKTAIAGFRDGGEDGSYPPINHYGVETGSPILAFDEDYRIVDRSFFNQIGMVQVSLPDRGIISIPLVYPSVSNAGPARGLVVGRSVPVKLVPLGEGGFYEPLSIKINGTPYVNSESMREYTVLQPEVEKLEENATVVYYQSVGAGGVQSQRAALIYNRVKSCLIERSDIGVFLTALCAEDVKSDGMNYRFFHEQMSVGGIRYYFVTAQAVTMTGFEEAYANRFFYGLYCLLGVVIIVAALVFSRQLSLPIRHLSKVTESIAQLDFSGRSGLKRQDELGQLSDKINMMSDSLQQALSDLERSNQELSQATALAKDNEIRMKLLLADLAHEFKTPLWLISGFFEAIRMGVMDNEIDYYYDIIERDLAMLTDMVNEAIELATLQSGNWSVHPADHSFADIVLAAFGRFEKKLNTHGFTVSRQVADVTVFADAHRISQVITNFLSNAMKYCDENRRIVLLSSVEGDHLVVEIGNSGYISKEQEDKIWNREYYTPENAAARLPSQGIGLDIAKNILLAHDSHFGVEQRDGMVYFYFTLRQSIDSSDS